MSSEQHHKVFVYYYSLILGLQPFLFFLPLFAFQLGDLYTSFSISSSFLLLILLTITSLQLGAVCSGLGLQVHCDGARLMNAAVALGTSPVRLVQSCNSVTLCLNKGLGAPMGSVIAGTREFINR